MIVDIIIPTTFDPKLTYDCVQSIFNKIRNIQYEITIIDNKSDPIFNMDMGGRGKIKRFDERLGFAKSMNEGIRNTNNEFILLLNNDTLVLQSNFLTNLLETLVSEENIGIVSPCTNFICTNEARCSNIESLPKDIIEHKGHIAAVCWMIKRSTINKIGMFDEAYLTGAFEDGDYCQRILNAGYKIMIDRHSFLFHYGSRTVSKVPEYVKHFGENHQYYKNKWNVK